MLSIASWRCQAVGLSSSARCTVLLRLLMSFKTLYRMFHRTMTPRLWQCLRMMYQSESNNSAWVEDPTSIYDQPGGGKCFLTTSMGAVEAAGLLVAVDRLQEKIHLKSRSENMKWTRIAPLKTSRLSEHTMTRLSELDSLREIEL